MIYNEIIRIRKTNLGYNFTSGVGAGDYYGITWNDFQYELTYIPTGTLANITFTALKSQYTNLQKKREDAYVRKFTRAYVRELYAEGCIERIHG